MSFPGMRGSIVEARAMHFEFIDPRARDMSLLPAGAAGTQPVGWSL